jgi:hypothetical protein
MIFIVVLLLMKVKTKSAPSRSNLRDEAPEDFTRSTVPPELRALENTPLAVL